MHPTRALQLLAAVSVAQASWINFRAEPRDEIVKRQTGVSGAETTTSVAQTTTSAPAETTTTAAPVTSTTPSVATTSTTAAPAPTTSANSPSTTAPTESAAATTSRSSSTSAAGNNDESTTSSSAASTTPATTAQPVTSTIRTIITTTNSAGQATSFTSESTVTHTPGLNDASSSDSSSGMSTQTRNTVIGVVVGVGGAIVLGALGFVAWRIWGKKKQAEENDGLMEYNNQYGNEAKAEVGSAQGAGRTPFQSTLESYHAPNQVNASSNF
ncbi:cell wall protein [Colletotrichum tofieldiae]|uniref:Cell wall protein n=1 Tax=Colletotrichum tofieldiae TaxID=708197 RepID=A0A166LW86_9PEZI|nr:cell wall protein [Colletotrichum tofieldiae]GKT62290.1 cell wall protein [Colletotrichum tofieldiae]GKT69662.1 cell wall protein [Colletotrichum tofieldiae]GKT92517.1 cell wall protein [Colletotrichum tofieldiae]